MIQSFSISITLTSCLSKVSLIRGKDDGFNSPNKKALKGELIGGGKDSAEKKLTKCQVFREVEHLITRVMTGSFPQQKSSQKRANWRR